ncbi:MAG: hypothetical protein GC184_06915 [Rhizobiales bacterium]|nr:hypothetical protein [Hyphomicrobiales bacterium]
MTSVSITTQRLAELIDAYGASPERWPASEREQALALLARSPVAREQMQQARQLDNLLDMAPVARPSVSLEERIMAARPRSVPPVKAVAAAPARSFWAGLMGGFGSSRSASLPSGMLAASIVLGLTLGTSVNALEYISKGLNGSSATTTASATTLATTEDTRDQFLGYAVLDSSYAEELIR